MAKGRGFQEITVTRLGYQTQIQRVSIPANHVQESVNNSSLVWSAEYASYTANR
jgi:hypothetical protein